MATLPVTTGRTVGTSGLPNAQQSIGGVSAESAGGIAGQQLQQLGAVGQQAGLEFMQQQQAEQRKAQQEADQARVASALADTQMHAQKMTFDPTEGFKNQTGEAVFKRDSGLPLADEVRTNFDKYTATIEATLGNDSQRLKYRSLVANDAATLYGSALSHEADQSNKLQISAFESLSKVAQDSIPLYYNDPNKIAAATAQIATSMRQLGAKQGWSADDVAQRTQDAVSGAHLIAIAKMQTDGKPADVRPYIDKYGAAMNPADLAKANGTAMSISTEGIQNDILTFETKKDAASIQKTLDALVKDNSALSKQVTPAQRNALQAQAMTALSRLQARVTTEANKREQDAKRAASDIEQQIFTGKPIAAAKWQEVSAALTGTTYAANLQNYQQNYNEMQKFSALPLPQQTAFLRDLEAKTQGPSNNPKATQQYVDVYRKIYASSQERAKSNPLEYISIKTGYQSPALDLSKIGTPQGLAGLTTALQDRFSLVAAQQKTDGRMVSGQVFYPEEIAVMKDTMGKLSDEQKLNTLSMLAQASGGGSMYGQALDAVSADDPALRLAGYAQAAKLKSTMGSSVANLLLAGSTVRKNKTLALPNDAVLTGKFNTAIGKAVPIGSQAHTDYLRMTQYIYAGLAARDGKQASNPLTPDDDLVELSIKLATGGVAEHAGEKIIKPYGMDGDAFDARVTRSLETLASIHGVDIGLIEDMPLMPILGGKDGHYHIADGKGGVMTSPKTGLPMEVAVQ
jgi:hypothetical protein